MNQPRFVCGALDYTIEHPSNWNVKNVVGKYEEVTLGGTTVQDVTFRKYQYELSWEAISVDDYAKLLELFNAHLDNSTDVTFTYQKWPNASTGVACKMDLADRGFVAGSGNTAYLSSVVVVLTEVEAR